jgi:hypothetical protein
LTVAEQDELDTWLEPARTKLSTAAVRAAWLEGWVMPVETAVAEVLKQKA